MQWAMIVPYGNDFMVVHDGADRIMRFNTVEEGSSFLLTDDGIGGLAYTHWMAYDPRLVQIEYDDLAPAIVTDQYGMVSVSQTSFGGGYIAGFLLRGAYHWYEEGVIPGMMA